MDLRIGDLSPSPVSFPDSPLRVIAQNCRDASVSSSEHVLLIPPAFRASRALPRLDARVTMPESSMRVRCEVLAQILPVVVPVRRPMTTGYAPWSAVPVD